LETSALVLTGEKRRTTPGKATLDLKAVDHHWGGSDFTPFCGLLENMGMEQLRKPNNVHLPITKETILRDYQRGTFNVKERLTTEERTGYHCTDREFNSCRVF